MKALVNEQEDLAPSGAPPAPGQEALSLDSKLVRSSFQVWLQEIKPCSLFQDKKRHLTIDERAQVRLATIRESTTHRHWPKEVVERFLAVEVNHAQTICKLADTAPEVAAPLGALS